jgi:glutaredoxin
VSVDVVVYGAPDCGLCEDAKRVLAAQQAVLGFTLSEVDISGDEELERRFREEIPVVFVGGRKAFTYRVDALELARRVQRAGQSESEASQTAP